MSPTWPWFGLLGFNKIVQPRRQPATSITVSDFEGGLHRWPADSRLQPALLVWRLGRAQVFEARSLGTTPTSLSLSRRIFGGAPGKTCCCIRSAYPFTMWLCGLMWVWSWSGRTRHRAQLQVAVAHYVRCLIPQLSAGHDSCRSQCAAREAVAVGAEGCAITHIPKGLRHVIENQALWQATRMLGGSRATCIAGRGASEEGWACLTVWLLGRQEGCSLQSTLLAIFSPCMCNVGLLSLAHDTTISPPLMKAVQWIYRARAVLSRNASFAWTVGCVPVLKLPGESDTLRCLFVPRRKCFLPETGMQPRTRWLRVRQRLWMWQHALLLRQIWQTASSHGCVAERIRKQALADVRWRKSWPPLPGQQDRSGIVPSFRCSR